ncbi:GtrA family protein [Erythrobacter sp.]|uniref:GtrA family protein n=1 Tax=Erythrobacter sp. TaxID=1042 RepID=UPI00311DDE54
MGQSFFGLAANWRQVLRYYQAGIVNTLFGYGCFAALVWLSFDIFTAQILSHIFGTIFNYFTYSRYSFSDEEGSAFRFILSYVANYLISLVILYGLTQFISSAYFAGLLTILVVSVVNFFVLKRFVFRAIEKQS